MGLAQIKMPQLGESVTEGTVDHWLKNEGDFVKRDEPLVEVVTDKVNAEIPSPFEGKLVKITAAQGETVQVGTVIAQIEVADAPSKGAQATKAQPEAATAAPAVAAPPAREPSEAPGPAPEVAAGGGGDGRARLSPAVRKLAAEHGLDPATLRAELAVTRVHYNTVRLHAGIGYVTPDDEHNGRGEAIRKARQAGLEQARLQRLAQHRQQREDTTKQGPDDVV